MRSKSKKVRWVRRGGRRRGVGKANKASMIKVWSVVSAKRWVRE